MAGPTRSGPETTVTGTRWVRVCALSDLVEDEGLRVETVPPIAIFLTGGELFCTDDTCTHETYSLAEGWIEGCAVECVLHQAKFDLRTGAATPPAGVPVRVHPIRADGDDVHVLLPATHSPTGQG